MYLTDQDIHSRIQEFQFQAEPGFDDFDPNEQIGPCSVDLRLSSVYWKPEPPRPWRLGRRLPLDLTRSAIMEANPTRGWRRTAGRSTDVIVLKPGQMILGRTCETFRIPTDCAAAIEGRSSFARLGLSVHVSGGFINPGYYGQMPLTLVNHSPFTLRIPAGLHLCQLMLIPLAKVPKQDYAAKDPKYLPDYGGPSYWWRDSAVERLHQSLASARYDDKAIDSIVDLFAENSWDNSVYERMEKFLAHPDPLRTADDLLDRFGKAEDRRQLTARTLLFAARGSFVAWLGIALPYLLFDRTTSALVVIAVISGVITLGSSLWGLWQPVPEYLTSKRIESLRRP